MNIRAFALASFSVLAAASLARAAGGEAFTEAASAGPDFQVQGEYRSVDGDPKWGAHVIALGEGKFDVVGYRGGLPAEGWQRGDERKRGTGELKDGVLTATGDDWRGTIRDGVLTVSDTAGNKLVALRKEERKSPTLGAAASSGAIVLFDGSSADNFVNGKLVEGNLLGATGCESKQKFNDHTLHIEFRTPFMPKSRGQARGNSGVYIQSRYECQVLDSFGLEGENNECGGIYKQQAPAVNACLPPLAWQTYDIDFKAARYDADGKKTRNARVTIRHNGVLIYDDLELTGSTPGRHAEGNSPDALFLQDHGNPVAFRNIWVVER
ncbi:MAG: DUF1080 domain-containing protein [Planctomycetes bacterium]|nr:DUF1080 domain-containing protein [Planctomycetota bacterium]